MLHAWSIWKKGKLFWIENLNEKLFGRRGVDGRIIIKPMKFHAFGKMGPCQL